MGQPKVSFTLGKGGLQRPLQGFDHYSLMKCYYYAASANSSYSGIGDAVYTSLEDAEADGVVNDFADSTAATSAQTVTAAGTNGDTVDITFPNWDGTSYAIGSYTKVSGDNTVTLVATAIVAAINANTYLTGFTATLGSTGAYTITAPKRWGIYPNTKSVTNTLSTSATIAITNNAFSSGTKSNLAMFHYQISEFFRLQPGGILYFSISLDDSANTVSAFNAQLQTDILSSFNKFSSGQALQVGVYNPFRTFATSTLTSLKASYTTLFNQYTPASFLYSGGYAGALSAQVNLRTLLDDHVSPVISQSGTGVGLEYSYTQQQNVGGLGAALGTVAACNVSQSMAEPGAFNISDGAECEKAFFFDGTDFDTISTPLADQLCDYGYIFLKKFRGLAGTYWVKGNCAVSTSSDYSTIEACRPIDKAQRQLYISAIPLLNSKNTVNANGTLSEAQIAIYNEKCDVVLAQMQRDTDINDYRISVSRTEVVSTTKTIPIVIEIQPTPTSEFIKFTLGYKASFV